jgi:hypothetical protein
MFDAILKFENLEQELYPDKLTSYGVLENTEGFINAVLKRIKKYFTQTYKEEWAPLKDVGKNAKYAIYYGVLYGIFKGLGNMFSKGSFASEILKSMAEPQKNIALNAIRDISPLLRTTVVGFGSGLTNIERVWVYTGDGRKDVLYFSTFKEPNDPTPDLLDERIKYIKVNRRSFYDKAGRRESDPLMSREFLAYSADFYTAGCYPDHFADEPTTVHRWFVKEDTKGSWLRDLQAEARLDPKLDPKHKGKVEVYKKPVDRSGLIYWIAKNVFDDDRPKSGKMSWMLYKGAFAQFLSYIVGGGIVAAEFMKSIGSDKEGIRNTMHNFYKRGSAIHTALGYPYQFTFEC